jgi:hypothetical protein
MWGADLEVWDRFRAISCSMPIYEYVCEHDGSVVELLRPIGDADKPVKDPQGKGRVYKRAHSTFATGGASTGASSSNLLARNTGGCCPCGKGRGACSSGN